MILMFQNKIDQIDAFVISLVLSILLQDEVIQASYFDDPCSAPTQIAPLRHRPPFLPMSMS